MLFDKSLINDEYCDEEFGRPLIQSDYHPPENEQTVEYTSFRDIISNHKRHPSQLLPEDTDESCCQNHKRLCTRAFYLTVVYMLAMMFSFSILTILAIKSKQQQSDNREGFLVRGTSFYSAYILVFLMISLSIHKICIRRNFDS